MLRWRQTGRRWLADGRVGQYQISQTWDGSYATRITHHRRLKTLGTAPTLAEAKAWTADYDTNRVITWKD